MSFLCSSACCFVLLFFCSCLDLAEMNYCGKLLSIFIDISIDITIPASLLSIQLIFNRRTDDFKIHSLCCVIFIIFIQHWGGHFMEIYQFFFFSIICFSNFSTFISLVGSKRCHSLLLILSHKKFQINGIYLAFLLLKVLGSFFTGSVGNVFERIIEIW